jgi:cytochrome P450 family 142 subfamily A polypeptide 1
LVLSRFKGVALVSKDPGRFCSGHGVLPLAGIKLSLIDEDESRHSELRRLINRGFTPRMVRKLEAPFELIVDEALRRGEGRGEFDFVREVAVPLALLLIAEMIGIRFEDFERFHHGSDSAILAQGRLHGPDVAARAGQAFAEYAACVAHIIESRPDPPQDDLISILVHAKDEGLLSEFEQDGASFTEGYERPQEEVQLGNDELIMICVLLMVAGNETTRNALSGSIQLLIKNPEEPARLVADPLTTPTAVEELLRLTSPAISSVRTATRDTVLRGRPIREGQRVLMLYPSANRNPACFAAPDALDLQRKPQHVAFGLGNHFCLGANLGRMELHTALREILPRMPGLRYAAHEPVIAPSSLVRSFAELSVDYGS